MIFSGRAKLDGAPQSIRTTGLFLRREALYPAELGVREVPRAYRKKDEGARAKKKRRADARRTIRHVEYTTVVAERSTRRR